MKEYTTIEALRMLTENPKLVFEDTNCEGRIGYLSTGFEIAWLNYNGKYREEIALNDTFLNHKWILASHPVSFMEAINSRKYIKGEGWGTYHPLSTVFSILSSERDVKTMCDVINGKWYIEEE